MRRRRNSANGFADSYILGFIQDVLHLGFVIEWFYKALSQYFEIEEESFSSLSRAALFVRICYSSWI